MGKGNPNPTGGRPLSPEDRAKGPPAGAAKRKANALERQAFEIAFSEAARDIMNIEAYELRKRLVAKLCAEALKGKPWAMEKAIAYLFGNPRQDVSVSVSVRPPDVIPEVPEEMREELRCLRDRMHELRGRVIGENGDGGAV